MKTRSLLLTCLMAGVLGSGCEKAPTRPNVADGQDTGRISGNISPAVGIKILAKLTGSDASKRENVKGEVLLQHGGAFTIDNLPPGKYDLLFSIWGWGDAAGNSQTPRIAHRWPFMPHHAPAFTASNWFEIDVEAGKTTSGINYRLTPAGMSFLIDEVVVSFTSGSDDARATIAALGCRIKSPPSALPGVTFYLVDIPDDKSVGEMVEAFKAIPAVASASPNYIAHPAGSASP